MLIRAICSAVMYQAYVHRRNVYLGFVNLIIECIQKEVSEEVHVTCLMTSIMCRKLNYRAGSFETEGPATTSC